MPVELVYLVFNEFMRVTAWNCYKFTNAIEGGKVQVTMFLQF